MTTTDRNQARIFLGFRDGNRGTHSSRSLMIPDLEALLDAADADAEMPEYRRLAVELNVLGKPTSVTREHSVRKLKALYGLDPSLPVFRALRRLWDIDEESRPLLSMLAANARDPLVRLCAPAILGAEIGALVTPADVAQVLAEAIPGRFSAKTATSIATRVVTSFTQSGHLDGKTRKVRGRANPSPVSATYAFFLAYCEGYRANRILGSPWARLLDAPMENLQNYARGASRRGLMNYKQMGNVVDLRFPDLLTSTEEELTHGQG